MIEQHVRKAKIFQLNIEFGDGFCDDWCSDAIALVDLERAPFVSKPDINFAGS